jgi:ADP-ribose/FAD diphosphatase
VRRYAGEAKVVAHQVGIRSDVPTEKRADEAKVAALHRLNCLFCKRCGSAMALAVPPGEEELRHVCTNCGFVDYHNPKMVVGCVVEHKGQVLLCKRALEPCRGMWTLPAGFMELGETSAGVPTGLTDIWQV